MQGALHEDRYAFLAYFAQFFLECERFHTTVVEKLETRV
jgi:hypothetical protein